MDPKELRVVTTVVESIIQSPEDTSLLWDGYRVLKRLLAQARKHNKSACMHRFHDTKVKGYYMFVTRYLSSNSKSSKQRVKSQFRYLINSVVRIVEIAEKFCCEARKRRDIVLSAIGIEVESYLEAVKTIVDVTKRVVLSGETVPASERTFSIFEQHVELIKRGKRNKRVEFAIRCTYASRKINYKSYFLSYHKSQKNRILVVVFHDEV